MDINMEGYSALFSKEIANCIFICVFHMWMHKLSHNPKSIANLALPLELSVYNTLLKFSDTFFFYFSGFCKMLNINFLETTGSYI